MICGTKNKANSPTHRPCTHEVVSERFHDTQNENDMNDKNYDRMKFFVFVLKGKWQQKILLSHLKETLKQ